IVLLFPLKSYFDGVFIQALNISFTYKQLALNHIKPIFNLVRIHSGNKVLDFLIESYLKLNIVWI
ncbi:MAG: hypothetical protein QW511_02840, partial [Candidatus Methanomethylicia archaeon]